jgi:hypothetical protein
MNQLAADYSFHGRIRRIGKKVLHCLIVFPSHVEDPQDSVPSWLWRDLFSTLLTSSMDCPHSEFLTRPFQVMKTTPCFVDENGNPEEPEDAASELGSVSGASSYN